MNSDFKLNWYDIILPLLSLPKVKKSIKQGIIDWIESDNCYVGTVYDTTKCPASYGKWWDDEEYKEKIEDKLLLSGYLKPDINQPTDENELDDYWGSPLCEKYMKYKDQVLKPFIKYHERTELRSYQMFGACHWWNPTFGLTLAQIIYPNETWRIRVSKVHTTVTNKDNSLVFDILYFDEKDDTKGGKKALSDSTKRRKKPVNQAEIICVDDKCS